MKLAPIISATVITHAGGFKLGNLSQLLPEALPSRIQNVVYRKSTAHKRKKIYPEGGMQKYFIKIIRVSFKSGNTTSAANTDTRRLM